MIKINLKMAVIYNNKKETIKQQKETIEFFENIVRPLVLETGMSKNLNEKTKTNK